MTKMILEDPTYFGFQYLNAADRKLYRAVYEQGVQEIAATIDGGADLECKLLARHHNYTPQDVRPLYRQAKGTLPRGLQNMNGT